MGCFASVLFVVVWCLIGTLIGLMAAKQVMIEKKAATVGWCVLFGPLSILFLFLIFVINLIFKSR